MAIGGAVMEEEKSTPYSDVLTALEQKIESCSEIVTRKQIESELATSTGAKLTKLILDSRQSAAGETDPVKALKALDTLSIQLLSFLQQQPASLLQEKAYYSGQIASSQELMMALKQKEENLYNQAQKEEDLRTRITSGEFKGLRKVGTRPEKLRDIRAVEAKMAKDLASKAIDKEINVTEEE
jgi:hypothetical protein